MAYESPVDGNGNVDWSKVRTERQEAEHSIRRQVEGLCESLSSVREVFGLDEDDQNELTPSEVQEALADFAHQLHELARLFRAHLAAVDLDDTAKAIGVSGGNLLSRLL